MTVQQWRKLSPEQKRIWSKMVANSHKPEEWYGREESDEEEGADEKPQQVPIRRDAG